MVWRMKLFADTPVRRTLQVVADLLFVAWLVLWVWIGMAVHDGTLELAGPARQTDSAATSMAEQLRDAGGALGEAPLIGDELAVPFDKAADASDGLAAAGRDTVEAVETPRAAPRTVGRAHPDPHRLRHPPAAALALHPGGDGGREVHRCAGGPRPLRAAGPRQPADAGAGEGQRRPGGSLAGTRPRRGPQAGGTRAGGRRAAPRQASRRVESGDVQFLHDVPGRTT